MAEESEKLVQEDGRVCDFKVLIEPIDSGYRFHVTCNSRTSETHEKTEGTTDGIMHALEMAQEIVSRYIYHEEEKA